MKRVKGLALSAVVVGTLFAEVTLDEATTFMQFPGSTYPSPTGADWDGDGDLDMLVGLYMVGKSDETAGEVHFLENIGSDSDPQYENRGAIESSGFTLTVGGSS